ncbi:MAG: NAD-dependent epimerase/dehydratase family protein, partial [Phycisphaeraceae bacterium]|nr:NAD-dependent epimerase/dehydratase family protein [Phycisphaeraceae bacterium]
MKILVTGGAGYIGSHAVYKLLDTGHQPVVLDNLERGHRAAVANEVPLIEADLRETDRVADVLTEHGIEGVMHFAALAFVGESVDHPLRYYDNNSAGTLSLLQAMDRVGCRRMVFSSTCA